MVNWIVWLLWLSISLSIQEFHLWFFHISCSLSASPIIISSLLSSSQMILITNLLILSSNSISLSFYSFLYHFIFYSYSFYSIIIFNHYHIIIISNCDSEWYSSHQIIIILIFYLNRFYIILSIQSISIHNFKHSSSDKQSIHILNSLLFPYSISLSFSFKSSLFHSYVIIFTSIINTLINLQSTIFIPSFSNQYLFFSVIT